MYLRIKIEIYIVPSSVENGRRDQQLPRDERSTNIKRREGKLINLDDDIEREVYDMREDG